MAKIDNTNNPFKSATDAVNEKGADLISSQLDNVVDRAGNKTTVFTVENQNDKRSKKYNIDQKYVDRADKLIEEEAKVRMNGKLSDDTREAKLKDITERKRLNLKDAGFDKAGLNLENKMMIETLTNQVASAKTMGAGTVGAKQYSYQKKEKGIVRRMTKSVKGKVTSDKGLFKVSAGGRRRIAKLQDLSDKINLGGNLKKALLPHAKIISAAKITGDAVKQASRKVGRGYAHAVTGDTKMAEKYREKHQNGLAMKLRKFQTLKKIKAIPGAAKTLAGKAIKDGQPFNLMSDKLAAARYAKRQERLSRTPEGLRKMQEEKRKLAIRNRARVAKGKEAIIPGQTPVGIRRFGMKLRTPVATVKQGVSKKYTAIKTGLDKKVKQEQKNRAAKVAAKNAKRVAKGKKELAFKGKWEKLSDFFANFSKTFKQLKAIMSKFMSFLPWILLALYILIGMIGLVNMINM